MLRRTKTMLKLRLLSLFHPLFQAIRSNQMMMMMMMTTTITTTNLARLAQNEMTTMMTMIKTLRMSQKRKLETRMMTTIKLILCFVRLRTLDTLLIQEEEETELICSRQMIHIKDTKIYMFRPTKTMMMMMKMKMVIIMLLKGGMLRTHNMFYRKRRGRRR